MSDSRLLAFFPQPLIDLQIELSFHPVLVELLQKHPAEEFEIRMAEIATYLDIILDGYYSRPDLVNLAKIMVRKLREKRGAVDFITVTAVPTEPVEVIPKQSINLHIFEDTTMEHPTEKDIEKEIQDKNLNAPRLTPDLIDSVCISAQYYVFPGTQLTVCCLTLKNGFTVTGESACASPENFDKELGKKIAYRNAREKVWQLEGYLLKERLYKESPDEGAAEVNWP